MDKQEFIKSSQKGFTQIPNELYHLDINSGEKLLMFVVAKWDGVDNKPLSTSFLMQACSMSDKTVTKYLKSLMSKNLLVRGRVHHTNTYKVNWNTVARLTL